MSCYREEPKKAHFIIVPLPVQGHLIPMTDMGYLLAERGICVSLVITRANADRIRPIIERAKESNISFEFVELSFPNEMFGLPPGCESLDHITDTGLFRAFFDAIYSLDEPLETFIDSLERPPDCMITDMFNAWTAPVARKFGIPRVIFHGPSCFYISTEYNLAHHKVYDRVINENEYVTVPDFPIELQVTKAQTPGFLNSPIFEDHFRKKCLQEELRADGVVINTFLELERPFIENYERLIGKKVWTVGPFCLYNTDDEMKVVRGNKDAIDQKNRVLTWLDRRDAASVLYISFGSTVYTNTQQLMEIGRGLEASNKAFIWVMKKIEITPVVEKWLDEGFEERTKERGLIIVGWAPQVVILSHPAVGGFMTHCGWNSLLEAISTGVPMITWPRIADQFVNENFVVDVLRIGISLGVTVPNYGTEDVIMVKSEEIRKAVDVLMDGIEADEKRQRSKDISEKAKKAVEEGGSSDVDLADFIHYFTEQRNKLASGDGIGA
ncbi:Glycosyltransferase [Rhynchospora pubera]|uniref:Glycosyltransferase n=1 Tax=Rhynchospora pubera TaxID=906938 RepID=A0AAV8HQR0_9POAL|nr:Glycosyltransferase [Rhynchospora pubera]